MYDYNAGGFLDVVFFFGLYPKQCRVQQNSTGMYQVQMQDLYFASLNSDSLCPALHGGCCRYGSWDACKGMSGLWKLPSGFEVYPRACTAKLLHKPFLSLLSFSAEPLAVNPEPTTFKGFQGLQAQGAGLGVSEL